jgi:hypothetical protein
MIEHHFVISSFFLNRFFPDFDLVHLSTQTNLIRDLLDNNSNLRRLFSDTFISHFTESTSNH